MYIQQRVIARHSKAFPSVLHRDNAFLWVLFPKEEKHEEFSMVLCLVYFSTKKVSAVSFVLSICPCTSRVRVREEGISCPEMCPNVPFLGTFPIYLFFHLAQSGAFIICQLLCSFL